MTEVETIHRKVNGQQETFRVVTLTDATGQETVYRFRDTGHGHKYLGDGEPSEKAREAVAEFR
ncbi:hypothetical protein HALLA_09670 [Halostagnicola larsenii XH-48]|uniref:Uncharacterized protein n=1 Tax=Halostagnicola larsenii XH-48 TaxID=797299 RepID=W0JQJ3_9EURY|nr:hypothetical protein [Halostagnicola larsenii]AHG00835.1 hypothetical protein HALLA_09505 [Halostagnicola larsenii XH-48]AHG00854.1 hypothetical protein HALLA_09670 [Halostagnicola larsenii XH-48]